jgi:hypothetical protein
MLRDAKQENIYLLCGLRPKLWARRIDQWQSKQQPQPHCREACKYVRHTKKLRKFSAADDVAEELLLLRDAVV